MNIVETIKIVNEMQSEGVFENYALGGATAVIFYTEPIATQDVDIFISLKNTDDLMILAPIYEYASKRNYPSKAEHIIIADFPVQFLPTFNDLTREAVENANIFELEDTIVRVMRPEHLTAIMLDTGRTKDFLRINLFLENDLVNMKELEEILQKHDLSEKWKENKHRLSL
jgi:hypothetical protein